MIELINKVVISDLDEEQRKIAEVIGIESYKALVSNFGGLSFYIPKAESVTINVRNEAIRAEFDGTNANELALKYNLTPVWIRDITSEKAREIKRRPIDGQIALFG